MTMVALYYVTAVERTALDNWRQDRQRGGNLKPPPRHDLAFYFARGAAEAHRENLHPTWADAKVEEREETRESMHYAYGGTRGAPLKK
jgi:hypothetical protein